MLRKIIPSEAGQHVRCAFCGRGPEPALRFVSGPGVYICSECVEYAVRALEKDREPDGPD